MKLRWGAEGVTHDLEGLQKDLNDGSNFHSEVLELPHGAIPEMRDNYKSEMV